MKLNAETKVGIIVFVGIMILTYMSFQVGEFRVSKKSGKSINLIFDSVAGLSKDASVQVAGVEVGKVYDIRLKNGKALVNVRIYADIDIDRASKAYIRSVGLLGDKYIDIILGHSGVYLADGDTLVSPPESEDIGKLVGKLSSIADDFKEVSSSLRNSLGGKEGETSIREIVENFRSLGISLNQLVKQNEAHFSRILANIDEMSANLNATISANKEDLNQTIHYARSASGSLNNIFKKVDEGQGTLGRLINEDDLSENLNQALVSANDVLGVKKKYQTFVGLRDENLVEANDAKGYVSLKLLPRKDKFYLFELVSPEGTKGNYSESNTTTHITNTGTGAGTAFYPTDVTQTVHEEKTSDKIMFTAMFGRSFGQTSFRLGLEENRGGLGVDHTFFGSRMGVHFDLWDFQGENSIGGSAHAKLRADFNFLKYFYLNAGYDNFLNNEDSSLFYGAGIEFNDEDIKDLFSFLPLRH
jgi:phospholipid/cholesterol/gamma-HCH transport system substrate-binding protein